jgi:hypothetical protein
VSEAHYYACGGDRRYFDKYFKPHLTSIQLSKQGRAYMRAEIDAVAENIETRTRNGRACDEKGVNARLERERAASQPMPKATKSSASKSMAKRSSLDSEMSVRKRRKRGSRIGSSASPSQKRVDRVLELLSGKPLPSTSGTTETV